MDIYRRKKSRYSEIATYYIEKSKTTEEKNNISEK